MTALAGLLPADRRRVLDRLAELRALDRMIRERGTVRPPAPQPPLAAIPRACAGPDAVRAEIKCDREAALARYGVADAGTRDAVDTLMRDIEDGDTYRALYGQLTGRCGCCGKALTDPKSKLLGIGPDCRGYR